MGESDDVYDDTGSNDSDLENSAILEKPPSPSPSALRRPDSSYGRRSSSPVNPSEAHRFGAGGAAEGVVAVGSTAGGTTATSTAPLSPHARAAVAVAAVTGSGDGDADESGSSDAHDASFEVEQGDDVILEDDDVLAGAGSVDYSAGADTDAAEVDESPAVKVAVEATGRALSRDTSTDEVSDLITDPLAGTAKYINTVGSHAGTGVAARMMGMPRGRSGGSAERDSSVRVRVCLRWPLQARRVVVVVV